MKIIGFIDIKGKTEMILKGDSAMLVNRKPFFIPDGTTDIGYTDCVVVRISRLGKNISLRFTNRYWDAWTFGLDFCARDWLQEALCNKRSFVEATAFDNSLCIGQFMTPSLLAPNDLIVPIDEAIQKVSRTMTVRQGDYIFIQRKSPFVPIRKEDVITKIKDNNEILYCKIK